MKPPRSILDKAFIYRDSAHTNVTETFQRIRDEIEAYAEEERRNAAERLTNIIQHRRLK